MEEVPDEFDARTPGMGPSDAIFVFGTRFEQPAEIAAKLFHDRVAPVVVVTGGSSRQADGRAEARNHEAILRGRSVPADAILVEDRSCHTGENVDFALDLMVSHGIIPRVITAVVKVYHRRALITFAERSPMTDTIFAATYPVPLAEERRAKEQQHFADLMKRGVDPLMRTASGWRRTPAHGSTT